MIARIGQALYGPEYTAKLAMALGVTKRMLRRWEAGTVPVPEEVWPVCAILLRERGSECAGLAGEVAERIQGTER